MADLDLHDGAIQAALNLLRDDPGLSAVVDNEFLLAPSNAVASAVEDDADWLASLLSDVVARPVCPGIAALWLSARIAERARAIVVYRLACSLAAGEGDLPVRLALGDDADALLREAAPYVPIVRDAMERQRCVEVTLAGAPFVIDPNREAGR